MAPQPRTWPTMADVATNVARELAAGDEDMALRLLLDGVNRLPYALADDRLDEALTQPPSTGSRRWDTLLAASVRYRLHRMGLKPPRWTWVEPLEVFWWPVRVSASKEYNDMAHTPAELIRVGIFMDERGFGQA